MPETIDLINFPCGEDVTQWPKLTCTQPGQLDLQDAGLRLPDSRDILFQDNGQLRSFDDTHRLVFDRTGGLLELHEAGAIRFLTGSPTPTERLRILATGQVGIGTATPTQPLEVVGTVKATAFQGSGAELTGVSGTDSTKVLKGGDTMSGALSITAPGTGLRVTNNAAVGGTLTVGGHVGIGTTSPGQALDIVGQGLFRSAPWAGAVPGVAGTVIGFDPNNADGTGFLWSHTTTGVATRLWMDGNPIIFAPAGTERMRVDSGGNVGIGTTTPKAKLHVAADIVAGSDVNGQKFIFHTRTNGGGDFLHITGDNANGSWQWNKGISFVRATGNVGIGTTNPAFQLSLGSSTARTKLALYETGVSNSYGLGVVSGQFRLHLAHNGARFAFFDSAAENAKEIVTIGGSGNLVVTGTARKPGGGAWADLSDRQLKTNIQQLKGALDTLLRLRGVCFEWLEPVKQGNLTGPQIGMIAQEVETVLPDWVSTTPEGYKLLAIRGFEALTVEAFRELQAKYIALQAQHDASEARVKQLEAHVRASLPMDIYHRIGAV